MELKGRVIMKGSAAGPALVSNTPVSFFGCIDPKTGIVTEKGHELSGQSIKGKYSSSHTEKDRLSDPTPCIE